MSARSGTTPPRSSTTAPRSRKRDVDVNALTSAEIDSVVVSASGGLGAIAGGVAVYSIGSGLDAEGRSRLETDSGDFGDVNSYADDQSTDDSVNTLLAGSDDARIRDAGSRSQAARAGVTISDDLTSAAGTGTTATIGDADITSGGALTSMRARTSTSPSPQARRRAAPLAWARASAC